MTRIRILYQVFFFGLFLFLVAVTELSWMRGYPVRWFLELDPLVGLGTAIAAHTLNAGLIWGLAIVAVTVLFGRVFCGWVCPLGALHDFSGALFEARPAKEKIAVNQFRPLYNLKYYLLVALLVMAAGSSLQIGWLDPIPFLTRSMAIFVQPASHEIGVALEMGPAGSALAAVGLVLAGAAIGWLVSRLALARPTRYRLLRDMSFGALIAGGSAALLHFSAVEPRRFHWGLWIALLFVAALAMNRILPRFWCRALCPLGALLGLVARFSLWRIYRDPAQCNACRACSAGCHGAADPDESLRTSECLGCMNCRAACPEGGITFRFLPPTHTERAPSPSLDRRRLIGAAALGALWVVAAKIGAGNRRADKHARIRPPGSREEGSFLERCIKCGACMRVCPTNAVHPAMSEAGIEGLWTPILIFREGACARDCVLCGSVCPTGAIRPITLDEKLGRGAHDGDPIRLGTAFFDRGRCLAWANTKPCAVCEEVCPVSPKAIYTKETRVTLRDGTEAVRKLPYVEPERCVGCGICEKECPVEDLRAIRVSSVGETRSKANRMLLGPRG